MIVTYASRNAFRPTSTNSMPIGNLDLKREKDKSASKTRDLAGVESDGAADQFCGLGIDATGRAQSGADHWMRPRAVVALFVNRYGGHCKKRASISGEYQGRSAVISRVMQPLKKVPQYTFFSASVRANGFKD